METAALADVLRLRHLVPLSATAAMRGYALRIVLLLTKLDAALA